MADRTAAELFGLVFRKLGTEPTTENQRWARQLWEKHFEFDVSGRQMDCDEALKALGLARVVGSDEGPVIEYGPGAVDAESKRERSEKLSAAYRLITEALSVAAGPNQARSIKRALTELDHVTGYGICVRCKKDVWPDYRLCDDCAREQEP